MGQGQSSSNSGTPQETPLAKTDYYELLGVERTATEDEIKKAYRRKALELHPDRNYGNVENATRLFAEVQSAYEVLSDPQERAWYDSHRDVLLRGDDAAVAEGEEYSYNVRMTTADEVLKFMLRFSGRLEFSDKSSGFYGGLRDFLGRIAKEEQIACQWEGLHEVDYPEFGHRDDDYEDVVRPFYAAWNGFATKKSYTWKDRYRLSDAPDRRIRRLMERENKNLREEAIREYNDAVRSLIAFVRKRDPRYQENQKSEGERQKILRDAAAAQAARSRAARQARMEELDQAILPEWATSSAVNEHEGGFESEEEQEQHEFECVVCQKSFKSEALYRAHEKSKKHINLLKQLKKEMREEGHDLDLEGANRDDEQDGHCEEHVNPPSELVTAAVNDVGEDYNSGEKIPVAGERTYHEVDDESDDKLKENGVDASNVLNPPTEKSHGSYSPALPESDSASDSDPDYAPRSEIIDRLKAATLTPASETGEGTEGSNSDLPSQPKIGKAKLKRQKRAAATAAQKTTRDGGGGKREAEFKCVVCQAAFPSKTKLFSHIKDRGHAAPVSQVNNRGKGGKGRVK